MEQGASVVEEVRSRSLCSASKVPPVGGGACCCNEGLMPADTTSLRVGGWRGASAIAPARCAWVGRPELTGWMEGGQTKGFQNAAPCGEGGRRRRTMDDGCAQATIDGNSRDSGQRGGWRDVRRTVALGVVRCGRRDRLID